MDVILLVVTVAVVFFEILGVMTFLALLRDWIQGGIRAE